MGMIERQIEAEKTVREVCALAQVELAAITEGTEKQVPFASDLRNMLIQQIWTTRIAKNYQTANMAHALIAVCNDQPADARWWIDHKNDTMTILKSITPKLKEFGYV